MAKFEEEKVINALHTERAEAGKQYWYSDNAYRLKILIEHNSTSFVGKLEDVDLNRSNPFIFKDCVDGWEYIYPYEEPSKQRMTNRQFIEWLSKGVGEYHNVLSDFIRTDYAYHIGDEDMEIQTNIYIRPFGQTEWVEPTVDIYERDCKGGKE